MSFEQGGINRAAIEALAVEGVGSGKLTEYQARIMLGITTRCEMVAFSGSTASPGPKHMKAWCAILKPRNFSPADSWWLWFSPDPSPLSYLILIRQNRFTAGDQRRPAWLKTRRVTDPRASVDDDLSAFLWLPEPAAVHLCADA